MAFNLGGFAQGLTPALQALLARQQLQQQQDRQGQMMANWAAAQQAQQGVQQLQGGDQGAPPGPPAPVAVPGGQQMPQGAASAGPTPSVAGGAGTPPAGGTAPVGGASPVAPGASMSMPQALAVLQNPSATQAPQASLGQGAQPGPTPPPQPAGGGGSSPPTTSGVAQGQQDPWKRLQQNTASLIMSMRQANPRARPGDILTAAKEQLALMKGVDDSDKILMKEQIDLLKQQAALQMKVMGIEGRHEDVATQQAGATGRTTEAVEGRHEDVAAQQAGATGRTGMAVEGRHEDVATQQAGAGARTAMTVEGRHQDVATQQAGAGARAGLGGSGSQVALVNKLGRNPIGKAYLQVKTFRDRIDALADDPSTATNPSAQLDLVDASVQMASGGVARKAQFDKIAQSAGFKDLAAMNSYLASGRGIIGPETIANIKKSAGLMAKGATAAARQMFPTEIGQLEGDAPAAAPSRSTGGGGGAQPKRFKYTAQGELVPQ
jgi:hypothetical protein